MNRVFITTIGTSLLSNAVKFGCDVEPKALLKFLQSEPHKASAETNSLSRLLGEGDEVVLLHSQTDDGKLCAVVLQDYLRAKGIEVRERQIANLHYDERYFARIGLRNLVQTLAQEIRDAKRRHRDVTINATGGFKAEIAYATAVGLLFKVPVCYIHEKFGDIVTLPATPIGWDATLIYENEWFFDWIDAEPRPRTEVENRMHQVPETVRMLLEDAGDDCTYLSAMGEAYVEAFRTRIEESEHTILHFSQSAWRAWQKMEPSVRDAFERQFRRLKVPEIRNRVVERVPPSDSLIFPQGHVNERIFFSERDGKIHVLELTQHGPNYDSLLKKGVCWRDYQDDAFQSVP